MRPASLGVTVSLFDTWQDCALQTSLSRVMVCSLCPYSSRCFSSLCQVFAFSAFESCQWPTFSADFVDSLFSAAARRWRSSQGFHYRPSNFSLRYLATKCDDLVKLTYLYICLEFFLWRLFCLETNEAFHVYYNVNLTFLTHKCFWLLRRLWCMLSLSTQHNSRYHPRDHRHRQHITHIYTYTKHSR